MGYVSASSKSGGIGRMATEMATDRASRPRSRLSRSTSAVYSRARRVLELETRPSRSRSSRLRRPANRVGREMIWFRARAVLLRASAGTRARPRRLGGCRHFLRTSARCQRNSVRNVTRCAPRDGRGRWQAAAASKARSAAPRFGRATRRRKTSSSCRRTSSSTSLTSSPRRLRPSAASSALNAT
jgi:hypothetical protein